jgi:hypothetical protein
MRGSCRTLWWRVVLGLATLPLLSGSCVEIAQRAIINGFFDATTPLLDEQVAACLTAVWEGDAAP